MTVETGLAHGEFCVHDSVVFSRARTTCPGGSSPDVVEHSDTARVYLRSVRAPVQAGVCPGLSRGFLQFSLTLAIPPPCPSWRGWGSIPRSSEGWHLTSRGDAPCPQPLILPSSSPGEVQGLWSFWAQGIQQQVPHEALGQGLRPPGLGLQEAEGEHRTTQSAGPAEPRALEAG